MSKNYTELDSLRFKSPFPTKSFQPISFNNPCESTKELYLHKIPPMSKDLLLKRSKKLRPHAKKGWLNLNKYSLFLSQGYSNLPLKTAYLYLFTNMKVKKTK